MKIKNETEIQLMKILFKTSGKKPTKNVTSKRAYPRGIEQKYFRQLQSYFKPLTDYVKKYLNENLSQILRGDSSEIKLDAIPGDSFDKMLYNLENWLSVYMPDISDLPEDSNNNVIFAGLGKTADETIKFSEEQFKKTIEKGIHVNLPTSAPWWDKMKTSWMEDNYTLITSNAKRYVSQINSIVEQGVVNGLGVEKVTQQILKETESLTQKHCKLLARDQMGKLNGQISQAQMEEVGLDLYVWDTSMDDRVRESHQLMQGLLCRWDDASVCSYDNGKTWVKRPSGAVDLHPGQDIQCRCSALTFYPELIAEVENVGLDSTTEDLPPVQDLPEFEKEIEKNIHYTENEKQAVAYWTQGNDGWGYADLRAIANGTPIEETSLVKKQLEINNISRAEEIKDKLEKIYNNFEKAVLKAPAPESEFLYRISPSLRQPKVGELIDLEKFSSFTFKPTESFYNNFYQGNDTVIYVLKSGNNFANISNIGRDTLNIFTQEYEAVSKKAMSYKVTGISKQQIQGKKFNIVTLEYEKTNKIVKRKYEPPKPKVLNDAEKRFQNELEFQMKVMTEAMKRGIDFSDVEKIKELAKELKK